MVCEYGSVQLECLLQFAAPGEHEQLGFAFLFGRNVRFPEVQHVGHIYLAIDRVHGPGNFGAFGTNSVNNDLVMQYTTRTDFRVLVPTTETLRERDWLKPTILIQSAWSRNWRFLPSTRTR